MHALSLCESAYHCAAQAIFQQQEKLKIKICPATTCASILPSIRLQPLIIFRPCEPWRPRQITSRASWGNSQNLEKISHWPAEAFISAQSYSDSFCILLKYKSEKSSPHSVCFLWFTLSPVASPAAYSAPSCPVLESFEDFLCNFLLMFIFALNIRATAALL